MSIPENVVWKQKPLGVWQTSQAVSVNSVLHAQTAQLNQSFPNDLQRQISDSKYMLLPKEAMAAHMQLQ